MSSIMQSTIGTAGALTLYMCFGIGLTLYNRWFLSPDYYHFKYPVTLIMCHMFVSFVFAGLMLFLFLRNTVDHSQYWITRISADVFFKRFVPIGVLTGLDITLTSLALEHASVSFTEIIKSCIPAVLLMYDFITQRQQVDRHKIICIVLLCVGIALTAHGEIHFSVTGLNAALGASAAAVVKLILLDKMLAGNDAQGSSAYNEYDTVQTSNGGSSTRSRSFDHDHRHGQSRHTNKIHPVLSLFYFAPVAATVLIGTFFVTDYERLSESTFMTHSHKMHMTLLYILAGALLAYGLNSSELFIIKHTSALSLCVAGVVKLVLLVVISSILFDHVLSLENQLGFIICICGVSYYNYIKYHEDRDRYRYSNIQRYTEIIVGGGDGDLYDMEADMFDEDDLQMVDFLDDEGGLPDAIGGEIDEFDLEGMEDL